MKPRRPTASAVTRPIEEGERVRMLHGPDRGKKGTVIGKAVDSQEGHVVYQIQTPAGEVHWLDRWALVTLSPGAAAAP